MNVPSMTRRQSPAGPDADFASRPGANRRAGTRAYRAALLVWLLAPIAQLAPSARADAEAIEPVPATVGLAEVIVRVEALERQNRRLALEIEELRQQNASLLARRAEPGGASPPGSPAAAVTPANVGIAAGARDMSALDAAADPPAAVSATPGAAEDWTSRIKLAGDFRFRHETIDVETAADDRTRETIRARLAAAIRISDTIDAEIGLASGGLEPRSANSTLGAASSRKEVGLDLGYLRWRPRDGVALTAGKMRLPFVLPAQSKFFDNEIRAEGIAANYEGANGLFGSAFRFWLEERAEAADSNLTGAQAGWRLPIEGVAIELGAGYYDYGSVQGRFPGFADGLVNEFGNSVAGSGESAVFLYDYDIGQVFAEATLKAGPVPLQFYADYARNFAADNGLDSAYSAGVTVGKATSPGQWEASVLSQAVEKDALFGQWTDSDFAGGVTDNDGQFYRLGWMAARKLLLYLAYYDTRFDVDAGPAQDYRRWMLEFNASF